MNLTTKIRDLSSPHVLDTTGEEDYRVRLLHNFEQIGKMASANAVILNEVLLPLLDEKRDLSDGDVSDMRTLFHEIMDAKTAENLDLAIVFLEAKRLLADAQKKGDVAAVIRALDETIMSAGMMLLMTARFYPSFDEFVTYREQGLEAAKQMLSFLEPEAFSALPGPAEKEIVLINARYVCILFQRLDSPGDEQENEADLQILLRALALADDPFYRKEAPDYNWKYHVFRTLQYICGLTSINNERGLNKSQLKAVLDCAERFERFYEEDPAFCESINSRKATELLLARVRFLNGLMDAEEYRKQLLLLKDSCREDGYTYDAYTLRLRTPLEYIKSLDAGALTAEQEQNVTRIYRDIILHLHHAPKQGELLYLVGDLTEIMFHYIEVPDGISFQQFCLELIAAIHPPTFVHLQSVADFSVCLTKHLVRKRPELFVGTLGAANAQEVSQKEAELLDFVRQCALCHDVGKLYIIETVITYGRPLFGCEFDWIRFHPEIGAGLLSRHASTRPYAEAALGHHRWYNNGGGYPESFDFEKADNKTVLSVITCADCLDAATDAVGRSYKPGKTLEIFLEELREGSGTRYAPWLAELMENGDVREDIQAILSEGRDDNYRKAYRFLEGIYHIEDEIAGKD